MRQFVLLLAALGTAVSALKDGANGSMPQFRIISARSSHELWNGPQIQVTFASSSSERSSLPTEDRLLLRHYNPLPEQEDFNANEHCNYIGRLEGEPNSAVAVTGCLDGDGGSGKLEVTLLSEERNLPSQTFTISGSDGSGVEAIESPFLHGRSRAVHLRGAGAAPADGGGFQLQGGDEEINADEEAAEMVAEAACAASGGCTIPPYTRIVVKLGYESSLKAKVGASGVVGWLAAVMTHTQTHFNHASLKTKLTVTAKGSALYQEATWTAEKNLGNARLLNAEPDVDLYVWFCADPAYYGTVGIAYVGTTCNSGYKTSLNEWRKTAAATGQVTAHEIGHNLGMSHDFDTKHSGKGCTGLMDYGTPPDVWSACSVSDFQGHYASQNLGAGCIEAIGADGSTTTTSAPTTCNASWKADGFCDDENNNPTCSYDGGDCCNNSNTSYKTYCSACLCMDPTAGGSG